ncbi:enoyl-CoA hydratase-related protein [Bradyrhizobium sp. ORS 111]|uniref:enoyl-CoA hydratase-related protein n=1 Tax=Bradyrhizobium sp. ORS 111 TaxID=1685958 RepID=UPI00388F17C7
MIEVRRSGAIATVTLNRPAAHNALSRTLIARLSDAVDDLDRDPAIRAVVLTGGPTFCAGADIVEMSELSLETALNEDFSGCCDCLASFSKPLIAAVEGFAIGAGCELVEMCDIVVAGDKARLGHPEITLGTLSGAGGTQRLARMVGRVRAMDLVLTGRLIEASEAEKIGLVSRVVVAGEALVVALNIAEAIASRPLLALKFAKEAVDRAVSVGLEEGLRLERRLFHLTFATGELHGGTASFLARREARTKTSK